MSETNWQNQGNSAKLLSDDRSVPCVQVFNVVNSVILLAPERAKDLPQPTFTKNKQKYIRNNRLKWIIKSQLTKLLVRLRDMYERGDRLCHGNGLKGLWTDCVCIRDPSKYFPPLDRTVTYTGLLPALLPKHRGKVSNLFITPLGCSAGLVPCNLLVSNHINKLASIATSQLLTCLSLTLLHECDTGHDSLKFKQSLISWGLNWMG